ncbi:hypothetical protein FHR81_002733 [Actinoalloteichus hoggarensis]|uniref:Uncharacterized protein n=1 Tax=Actinoalloteichus hoggarensis TaxID=1470176 RepID=A0A221VXP9_9PSEU|nr:hypothetical protein AHOG_03360 [Actinoalloteichus hoggarensis]MBB5921693.1 hypothetical protein [Actinoalloteichus hoggarensis]
MITVSTTTTFTLIGTVRQLRAARVRPYVRAAVPR